MFKQLSNRYNKLLIILFAAVAIFSLAFSAEAAIGDFVETDWEGASPGNNLILEDTLTGLQWLDLSVTSGGSGLSVLDVFDMTGATPAEIEAKDFSEPITSGTYAGWRMATYAEVLALYANAEAAVNPLDSPDNFTGVDFLLQAMGGTVPTNSGNLNPTFPDSGPYQAEGYYYFFVDNGSSQSGIDDCGTACVVNQYTSFSPDSGSGFSFAHDKPSGCLVDNLDPKIGTYLVRSASVDEPAEPDYGDAPDATGTGPGIGDYATTAASNGPSHLIISDLFLGNVAPDADDGTLQNVAANADDLTNTGAADDEDGVVSLPTITTASTSVDLQVGVTNNSGSDATLACWIDFDRNGIFDNVDERQSVIIGTGTTPVPLQTLTFSPASNSIVAGDSYLRCRLATADAEVANPTGVANSGEVEDFLVSISTAVFDFGDVPDSNGQTTLPNGARHQIVTDLRLGACVDGEPDGQPASVGSAPIGDDDAGSNPPAVGSCNVEGDDEDGVTAVANDWSATVGGVTGSITAEVNGVTESACVYAWIDLDENGFDASDPFDSNDVVGNGPTVLEFDTTPYIGSYPSLAYYRLRIVPGACSTLSPTGLAVGGEVEDHALQFGSPSAVSSQDIQAASIDLLMAAAGFLMLTAATGMVFIVRRKESSLM